MWLISGKRNNLILQGTDGDEEGNSVPIHWTTDGTIQHEIIGYTQTNGAKLAYDIESDFIKCLQKKCPLGVNLANQGLYRGHGEDETGVHMAAIIVITNAKELHQSRKFAFSSSLLESRKITIKQNAMKHPNIYQFVDPSNN